MNILLTLLLLFVLGDGPKELTPKDSSAQQLLVSTSKDHQALQTTWETARQQTQHTFDSDKKTLIDTANKLEQDLLVRLRADKHYKDDIAKLDTVQKQLQDLDSNTTKKFREAMGETETKIITDRVEIDAYQKIVREENKWPATARWDEKAGKWFDK